jgi:Phosphotransferase enzyme family
MKESHSTSRDVWRVLIFRRDGSELLVARNSDHSFVFPRVSSPRNERTAPHLNLEIERRCGIRAVSLYELTNNANNDSDLRYHVVEAIGKDQTPLPEFEWKNISTVDAGIFSDKNDCNAFAQLQCRTPLTHNSDGTGPFARFGWFTDLLRWIEPRLKVRGIEWNGQFQQLTASPRFALIRFETSSGAVWFKAVGPPNTHEFPITLRLATHFPEYVPEILAVHPAWKGWLSLESGAHSLYKATAIDQWERAVISLARLQLMSRSSISEILADGAREIRTNTLLDQCDPFFAVMERLMQQQETLSPPPLSRSELRKLRNHLRESLIETMSLDIPDTLEHLDCNPGNITVSPTRVAFLDWAEAGIGNPFLTFEYLLEHFRRTGLANSRALTCLTAAYAGEWRMTLRPQQIQTALRLAPTTAAFAYAVSLVHGKDRNQIEAPHTAAALRSLARRMFREAEKLAPPMCREHEAAVRPV